MVLIKGFKTMGKKKKRKEWLDVNKPQSQRGNKYDNYSAMNLNELFYWFVIFSKLKVEKNPGIHKQRS